MQKLSLNHLKGFELSQAGSIWGGADCRTYTEQVDYTKTDSGGCTVDERCWVCDDVVSAGGGASAGNP